MMLAVSVLVSIILPWVSAAGLRRSPPHQAPLQAADEDSHRSPALSEADEGKQNRMQALLDRYAPVFKLSETEAYFPSSIDYMLSHFDHGEDGDGNWIPLDRSHLTSATLDQIPSQGSGIYLSIAEPHNPQPSLDPASEYLFGPAGQEGALLRDREDREIVREPVYAFWVEQERGVVDLWYWTYYPFNYGKVVGPFGILGNHVSDWERLRMRTVNGTAKSVDYNTHTGGRFSAGTIRWLDAPKIDDRPVAFVASGSHGVWPNPGDHVYADLLNVFKLVDVTDDSGPIWDARNHVVAFQYWEHNPRRRGMWHHGNASWLNFLGMWGNRGENDCWWHKAMGVCQIVGAPPGPNRGLINPPECLVSPLAWESSRYSFYLSSHVVEAADRQGISIVKVEQICGRPKRRDDDSDGDGDDAEAPMLRYLDDDRREEEWEIWTLSGMTSFRGRDEHIVTVPPCDGRDSAVKAYRISLCLRDGKCITSSGERKICTYLPEKQGYQFGNAAQVEDLDDWWWNV